MPIHATALIITLATQVLAEPSTNMRILMDSNVSILDWGMFKIERKLEKDGKLQQLYNLDHWVTYNWENDKINIHTHTFANTTKTMEQAKVQCKNIFETIERVFLVKDGKDMLDDCQICHVFSHEGWGNSRLRTARNEIKNKFELIAHNFKHKCTKKLYGETVNVSEVKY